MSIREWCDLALAVAAGYFWGQGVGMKYANKQYKGAIDLAVADYRESNRLILKLRNRLIGRRFLLMKELAKARLAPSEAGKSEPLMNETL